MFLNFKFHKSAGVPVTGGVHRLLRKANKARDAKAWIAAAKSYRAALDRDPQLTHIWIQLGHVSKEAGLPGEAEAAYRRASELDPRSPEPLLHLGHLNNRFGDRVRAGRFYLSAARTGLGHADALAALQSLTASNLPVDRDDLIDLLRKDAPLGTDPEAEEAATDHGLDAPGPALVFDVSDLISYFRNARLPTGIQRVQIETITNALAARSGRPIRICCFIEHRDDWLEIPASAFVRLSRLAVSDGDRMAPEWIASLSRLQIQMKLTEPLVFPDGAYLINLGTSWWLQNYFLFVRQAKARHNIRYVPFVHDLIPVMTPEHCVRELTQDFISWVLGVYQHADFYLVNSEATKRDLIKVAQRLGHTVSPDKIAVIHLDADFRKPALTPAHQDALSRWGLERSPYVLFISTIESRKNHLAAFDAWMQLVRRHGIKTVPKLVCVGNRGWLNDAVYARLEANTALKDRVIMLSGLSDSELALLYQSCLFTLYPSLYEGWGLPVTESLCYGKVPLISNASSLPEAGGPFAVYFDPGSVSELTAALERLMFDAPYRQSLERKIASEFAPRTWRQLAEEIEGAIAGWSHTVEPAAPFRAPVARLGAYYPLARNYETRIWPGLASAEVFRVNAGWCWPEALGCRIKSLGGRLEIDLPEGHGPLCAYFHLYGLMEGDCNFTLETPDSGPSCQGHLAADEHRWVVLDLPAAQGASPRLTVTLRGKPSPASLNPDGADIHAALIGLAGFFLCAADDAGTRAAFLDAIALGTVADLAFNRDPEAPPRLAKPAPNVP